MDRKIYLIRHGRTIPFEGGRRCIGITDVPLAELGRAQAKKLQEYFAEQVKGEMKIYSSPLFRCKDTAYIISNGRNEVIIQENLHEMRVGDWENLEFQEIKSRYPKEYEERGKSIGYYITPNGESFHEAGLRFGKCLEEIRRETTETILVVTHAGVIRGYLCELLGISANEVLTLPQPYGGINVLAERDGVLSIEKIGYLPTKFMDEVEMCRLYKNCKTPEKVVLHMNQVAKYLELLADQMQERFRKQYDWELLKKAALVHDIARTQKFHAEVGARILREEGYEEIADLVQEHHSAVENESDDLNMSELLFYADKRVAEDKIVTIDERFEKSAKKCRTAEAQKKHRQLYEKSKHIEQKIEQRIKIKEDE